MNGKHTRQKSKDHRVINACLRCRAQKKKCNGVKPCSRCGLSNSECIFRPSIPGVPIRLDNELNDVLTTIDQCVKKLSDLTSNDERLLQDKISNIHKAVSNFSIHAPLLLKPQVGESSPDSSSIECLMVKERRFSPNKYTIKSSDERKAQISKNFGLYSPLLCFSLSGISWLMEILRSQDEDGTKTGAVLFLKFLDDCSTLPEKFENVRYLSPFKAYAFMKDLDLEDENLERLLIEKALRINFSSEEINKMALKDPLNVFEKCIEIMTEQNSTLNHIGNDIFSFEQFLRNDHLLSSICLEKLHKVMYYRDLDTKILECSVAFVEHQFWLNDIVIIEQTINFIVRRAINLGLNRWEYYIDEEEGSAEKIRNLWLKIYFWDKWLAIRSGKQPALSRSFCSSLLPSKLIELGLGYKSSSRTVLNLMKIDVLQKDIFLKLGNFAISQIITETFEKLLYNENLTGYISFTKQGSMNFDESIKQASESFGELLESIQIIKSQILSLQNVLDPDKKIFELSMHTSFTIVSIFQAAENLFIRLRALDYAIFHKYMPNALPVTQTEIVNTASQVFFRLLEKNDFIIYRKYSWYVLIMFYNVVVGFLNKKCKSPLLTLTLLCGISRSYCMGSNLKIDHSNPPAQTTFTRHFTLMLILTSICCRFHMQSNGITKAGLQEHLHDHGQDSDEFYENIFDDKSAHFRDFLSTKRVSEYRQSVLRHLGAHINEFGELSNASLDHHISKDQAIFNDYNDEIFENNVHLESLFESNIYSDFVNFLEQG